jgi:hypothetical protein
MNACIHVLRTTLVGLALMGTIGIRKARRLQ